MKIKLHIPAAGTLVVEVEDEKIWLSMQDLIARPVEIEIPRAVVIEADEPPLTAFINTVVALPST